jgi:tetratricopeptide (TPR) repeat protein
VQKSGERVRITAQLVSATDGYHLWSQTYDRTLKDIFAVQDEIANEVARAMKITLLGQGAVGEAQPLMVSQDTGAAYNDYLKGLYEQNRVNMEANHRAIDYFRRALEEDPELAVAWAGLSLSLSYKTGFEDDVNFSAGYEEARASALRALELNPDLPEGHLALATVQQSHDWDWEAAEASLNQALALRPGDSEIQLKLARLKAMRGKSDEALAIYKSVVAQDPLDLSAQRSLANEFSARGRFEEALSIYDHIKEIEPARSGLHFSRGIMRLRQGDYQQALAEFSSESFEFFKLTGEAIAQHHLQQQEQAVATLQTLISTMGESSSYQIAEVYAQWGDVENALIWLERAYEIRDPGLQFLGVDFLIEPLQNEPRFMDFLKKMNF